ncbi:MAG: V-type ATP synthase subunit I [Candidatus Altiarchaeota archaeon]|nr:V-type ATP synthase subunit I [Candidatus Altiarchaeota archaeon]
MSKLEVIVLDQYLEDVVREFSNLGSVQITDIRDSGEHAKELEPVTVNETADKASALLGRIYYLLDILEVREERDFFGSLKKEPEKMPWTSGKSAKQLSKVEEAIAGIEKDVIKKSDSLVELGEEKARLEPLKKILESLLRLNIPASSLGVSRFLYVVSGAIAPEDLDRLEAALEKEGKEFVLKEASNGETISMFLATLREYKQDVDKLLEGLDFQEFSLNPEASIDLSKTSKRLVEIDRETKHMEKELRADKKKYAEKLLALREIARIEKEIAETRSLMGKTRRVYALEGWAPSKRLALLENRIEGASDGHAVVKTIKPHKDEAIPTKLDNPGIFKPFEVLVETFGMPSYKELDPTPLLALTFPLFYGLMFGDAGHGLVLVLLGLVAMKLAKSTKSVRSLGIIILVCGVFATFFGFLYGEAFGMSQHVQKETLGFVLVKPLISAAEGEHASPEEYGEAEGSREEGGFLEPFINPMEKPIDFLQTAVLIGAVHIGLGMVLDLVNRIRDKKYLSAIAVPLPKLWLYYGLVYLFYTYWIDFAKWGGNIGLVILLIPVPLILLALSEVIKHLPKLDAGHLPALLGEGAFEAFDTVLNFLSNSISYSRIFALALVHGGLFIALFEVAKLGMEVPVIGGVVWFLMVLAGTAAILALESIIVFLHSLRLHYYEWFTKFYAADGVKFAPFKAERVYTKIKDQVP